MNIRYGYKGKFPSLDRVNLTQHDGEQVINGTMFEWPINLITNINKRNHKRIQTELEKLKQVVATRPIEYWILNISSHPLIDQILKLWQSETDPVFCKWMFVNFAKILSYTVDVVTRGLLLLNENPIDRIFESEGEKQHFSSTNRIKLNPKLQKIDPVGVLCGFEWREEKIKTPIWKFTNFMELSFVLFIVFFFFFFHVYLFCFFFF